MNVGVVVFPGSNCDSDAYHAVVDALGAEAVRLWHKEHDLHGADVVPGRVLDLDSGRTTRGHRFMSRGDIDIATADAYEPTLLAEGKVIPSFAERRADIERQLLAEAAKQGALLNEYADLLDEVAALVEHPTVYLGEFEAEFLAVAAELGLSLAPIGQLVERQGHAVEVL